MSWREFGRLLFTNRDQYDSCAIKQKANGRRSLNVSRFTVQKAVYEIMSLKLTLAQRFISFTQ